MALTLQQIIDAFNYAREKRPGKGASKEGGEVSTRASLPPGDFEGQRIWIADENAYVGWDAGGSVWVDVAAGALPKAHPFGGNEHDASTLAQVNTKVSDRDLEADATKLDGVETGATKEVQATETVAGIAEIASQVEADAALDDTRFITPLKNRTLVGATAGLPGKRGLVPAPAIAQTKETLHGDGAWKLPKLFLTIHARVKDIKDVVWKDIGAVFWGAQDFGAYATRKIEAYVDMNGSTDAISIRAYDIAAAAVVGSVLGVVSSGTVSFAFTKPLGDTALELQVIKDTDISTDPIIYGGLVELE